MLKNKFLLSTLLLFLLVLTGCDDSNNSDGVTIDTINYEIEVLRSQQDITVAQETFINDHKNYIYSVQVTDDALFVHYKDYLGKSYIAKIADEVLFEFGPYDLRNSGSTIYFQDEVIKIYHVSDTVIGEKAYTELSYDGEILYDIDNYIEYFHSSTDGNTKLAIATNLEDDSIFQVTKVTKDNSEVIYSYDKSLQSSQYPGLINCGEDVSYIKLINADYTEKYVVFKDYEIIDEFNLSPEDRTVSITSRGYIFFKTNNSIEITDFNNNILNTLLSSEFSLGNYNYNRHISDESSYYIFRDNYTEKYIKVEIGGNVDYDYIFPRDNYSAEIAQFSNDDTLVFEHENDIKYIMMKNENDETLWSIPTEDDFFFLAELIIYDDWFAVEFDNKLNAYDFEGTLLHSVDITCSSIYKYSDNNLACITEENEIILYDQDFTQLFLLNDKEYQDEFYVTAEGNIIIGYRNTNEEYSGFPTTNFVLISNSGETLNTYYDIQFLVDVFVIDGTTHILTYNTYSIFQYSSLLYMLDDNDDLTKGYHVFHSITDSAFHRTFSVIIGDEVITYSINRY